ncbi:major capsid protein [Candidatus Macondimonas diazotrophica]|jgi:hypothetical protein|uniref:Phage major capsid protein n=1 Tax=Candidatus Macondimonas diazotrophica TaxID=2305248 RepID=A0A4Z0F8K6_9GAMM|nr:hypothetical protein [Candidatus Macondimonas diazotrophica]TFZ81601.1 hypothetical protein E4680_11915 [Candidatus Macondimonas diazotrophica]
MLTLVEAAKLVDGDVKRQAVIEMFASSSDLLRVMPFEDIPGDSFSYSTEGELPGVAFRGYNQGYDESTGIINNATEMLRIVGGDMDVDKAMIKTRGETVRSTHEALKVKSIALSITGKIINGDSEANPLEFDGLRKRIVGDQLIGTTASNGSQTSGGDPLSIELLDDAIDAVDNPTHLVMSKKMRNKLNVAARKNIGGDIVWDKDEFGTRIAYYNDLPILVTDRDNENNPVIGFNEACPGGGTGGTSIYIVSFGPNMITGLQNGILEVEDLGEIDAKPVYRTRLEWLVSFAAQHGRCAARVWGIKNADVVS